MPESRPASGPEADPAPRGPWSFMAEAVPGGFSRLGLQLMAGWLAFSLCTDLLWVLHLKALTGWSSLPNYWGETLNARDLWELLENGGLRSHWTGPWMPLGAGLAMLWFMWSGWRLQAAAAQVPARLGAWLWGLADALALGVLPMGALGALALWGLAWLGATGIQGLGWLDWVGGALVRLALVSALVLQWWLCRLGRARGLSLGRHLWLSLGRLWKHPVQWGALILGGVLARTGLALAVLALAWRMGGGTIPRVLAFLGLQLAVVLINAWAIGWFLRLTALYVRQDLE